MLFTKIYFAEMHNVLEITIVNEGKVLKLQHYIKRSLISSEAHHSALHRRVKS